MPRKTLETYKKDISKELRAAISNDDVTMSGTWVISVSVELEEEGYDKIAKNPVWVAKANKIGKEEVDAKIKVIGAAIDKASEKRVDPKEITEIYESNVESLAKDVAEAIETALEKFVADKALYKKYKIKSAFKVTTGAMAVAGGLAITFATGGALSPLAIAALVRSGITISQTFVKLALEAEGVEKIIRKELDVLSALINANKDSPALKTVKEIGLNALSGVLGIETPSLNNCEGRIELYKNKITGLQKKASELGDSVYKIMDANKDMEAKAKKLGNDPKAKKALANLGKGEKFLDAMLNKIHGCAARVETAEKHAKLYEATLDAMKKGTSKWAQYAGVAAGLAVDIGMGASEGEAFEKISNSFITLVTAAADEFAEHV